MTDHYIPPDPDDPFGWVMVAVASLLSALDGVEARADHMSFNYNVNTLAAIRTASERARHYLESSLGE